MNIDTIPNLAHLCSGIMDVDSPETATALAQTDAALLPGQIVYIIEAENCHGLSYILDRPTRVKITGVNWDRWMDNEHLDETIDFEFVDAANDTDFPADNGRQYGWTYGRTYRVVRS